MMICFLADVEISSEMNKTLFFSILQDPCFVTKEIHLCQHQLFVMKTTDVKMEQINHSALVEHSTTGGNAPIIPSVFRIHFL